MQVPEEVRGAVVQVPVLREVRRELGPEESAEWCKVQQALTSRGVSLELPVPK